VISASRRMERPGRDDRREVPNVEGRSRPRRRPETSTRALRACSPLRWCAGHQRLDSRSPNLQDATQVPSRSRSTVRRTDERRRCPFADRGPRKCSAGLSCGLRRKTISNLWRAVKILKYSSIAWEVCEGDPSQEDPPRSMRSRARNGSRKCVRHGPEAGKGDGASDPGGKIGRGKRAMVGVPGFVRSWWIEKGSIEPRASGHAASRRGNRGLAPHGTLLAMGLLLVRFV